MIDYVHSLSTCQQKTIVSYVIISSVHDDLDIARIIVPESNLSWEVWYQSAVRLVASHSGRTLVFDQRTFPVLRSTCS